MDKMKLNDSALENAEELEIEARQGEQIYPMDGIKVDKGFYTIFELKRKHDRDDKRIVLDSEFQREDVWKADKKVELVESVLMGLPLPIFYFNQDKYGRLIVVDGRQRLTALFDYMDDKYPLKKLKILPKLNDKKFSELSPMLRSRIEDFQIQAHVILPPTPDRIKFDIFDRVNRGGMQLNKQEIRNALYQGEATRLLNEIVKSEEFNLATGGAFVKDRRMKDKYLITRFITFLLHSLGEIKGDDGKRYVYKDDIDDFLGRGLDSLNNMDTMQINEYIALVKSILKGSYYYLGKDAFRLNRGERKSPINMNVFETIMYAMLWVNKDDESIKELVKKSLFDFVDSDEFRVNIGNHRDNSARLFWRLNKAEQMGRLFLKHD